MTLNVLIGNGSWYPATGGYAPVITIPTSLPSGTVNTAYTSTQFYASGTAPITWSNTGSLPSGMTFSSSGLLSGTPTATANSSITFTATNAYGSNNSVLMLTVNAAGVDPVLVSAPVIALSEFNSSGTINTAGAVLEITPGTYFQDAPYEVLSIQSVTRTTVAGYSRAWTVVLNTPFTTTLRNGFMFGADARRLFCGIHAVSGDKQTLTLVSDTYSPSPTGSANWNYQNVRVTTTTGAATTTEITINPGYDYGQQVGDTIEIDGYPLTYATAWVGRVATVSPALSSAPTVGTPVKVVVEPKTTDGQIAGPAVQKSWQWYRDGVAISGANSRLYTTTNADSGKTVIAKEYAYYFDLATGITTNTSNSASVTGLIDPALITKSNFSYLGSFRVPAASGSQLYNWINPYNWSGGADMSAGRAVLYKPNGDSGVGSLIIAGRNNNSGNPGSGGSAFLTEISIPATLDTTGVIANMPRGNFLTPDPYFFDIANGNQGAIAAPGSHNVLTCGAFIYNDNLYQNFKVEYQDFSVQTYFKKTGTAVNSGTTTGPFKFNAASPGYYSGPVCSVPTAWQTALGGPMLQGSWQLSNPEPQGNGPLIASFDPDTLGSTPATINLLASYSDTNPVSSTATNYYTNWARSVDFISGMAFPNGSKSVLAIGRHGIGRRSYGTPQRFTGNPGFVLYTPVGGDKGWYSYPYTYAVYAYSADDLAAAKAGSKLPYQVKPYAVWSIEFPGQNSQTTNQCNDSACFDTVNNRLFFIERESPRCQTILEPIIHVYQFSL